VWQRPQHLLTRLARQFNVTFIEEPLLVPSEQTPRLDEYTWQGDDGTKVQVVRLNIHAPGYGWIGHGDRETADLYEAMVADYLESRGIVAPIVWMYTPMATHFLNSVDASLLIYDVMDQLAAFKGAPAVLRQKEQWLLRSADLVFTGGLSLYHDKKVANENTYLFPSGVQIEHFARAAHADRFPKPAELANLRGPILGYYGVIDERMDLDLLNTLAEQRPHWQIVLIGPVVKIDPADLPQAPNLHYIGMRSYEQLPAYLAHFDVALIPFARNEATRYLSPTKTLEYMAAHKPIVSTPIHDVEALYGSVVAIGETADDFIAHIDDVLPYVPSLQKLNEEAQLLKQATWDAIAEKMGTLIDQTLNVYLQKLVS
jgi:glycosyltransferase involved in cell wall biosynthesis